MKILVIGGNSYIGEHLIKDLSSNKKFQISSISRNLPSVNKRIDFVDYINIDVLHDFNSLKEHLNNAKVIINLIGEIKNESMMKSTNFFFLKKLVDYIINLDLNLHLIQISSVGVYGAINRKNREINFINEKSYLNPNNLYEKTKRDADEYILKKFHFKNKSSFLILRPTIIVGKGMKSNVLRKIVWLVKNKFFIYFGYNNFFNFLHIKDFNYALILCIERISEIKNKIYIISNDCKQIDLINKIALICKVKPPMFSINIKIILFIYKILSAFRINLPLNSSQLQFLTSRVLFSNKKITKELNFNPSNSLDNQLILEDLIDNL